MASKKKIPMQKYTPEHYADGIPQPGFHYILDHSPLIYGQVVEFHDEQSGLLTVKAYSAACPEGEVGSAHITEILPVEGAAWRMMQARRWDTPKKVAETLLQSCAPAQAWVLNNWLKHCLINYGSASITFGG